MPTCASTGFARRRAPRPRRSGVDRARWSSTWPASTGSIAAGLRHRPVGGRRDDRGHAGGLSGAVRRRGNHRRAAVRQRHHAPRGARADARAGVPLAARAIRLGPRRGRASEPSIRRRWRCGTGPATAIVSPANATAIVDQWRDLHGLGDAAGTVELGRPGTAARPGRTPHGRPVIERYDISGMGHGTPLDTRGDAACGTAGPHMLEAGICSTRQMAGSWGLIGQGAARAKPAPHAAGVSAVSAAAAFAHPAGRRRGDYRGCAAGCRLDALAASGVPQRRLAGTATSSFLGAGKSSAAMIASNSSTLLPPPSRGLRARSWPTRADPAMIIIVAGIDQSVVGQS